MIEMTIIIAMAMSITPIIANYAKVPKKLRAWLTLVIIILLNVGNTWIFGDQQIILAIKQGINDGVIAVGIYSAGKNTMEYMKNGDDSMNEDNEKKKE